jgi:hypothetical protein
MTEEEEVHQPEPEPEEEGEAPPQLPFDAQLASNIFLRENVDGILDRGLGTFHALNSIRRVVNVIPPSCAVRDLLFLIESVGTEGDFIEETFINFYVDCTGILKKEFQGGDEDEVEEEFPLTEEFIADRLSDLQPVEGAEFTFNLTSFLVQNAEITKCDAIVKFGALLTISLKTNLISDILPFAQLERLKHLDLTENKVRSIDGIRFPSLEVLNLPKNQLSALASLDAPKLKTLDVSNNHIFFIAPFAFLGAPNVETLNLTTNTIRVLREQCFLGLSQLKTLKLTENQLPAVFHGISKDLRSLIDLDVSDNPLQSLAGLDRLTALEVLDAHKTGLEQPMDFSPLFDHCPLKRLSIAETALADVENVRLELIHYLPLLEEIDEQPVAFGEKQESDQLFAERAAEELRLFEEMQAAALAAAAEAAAQEEEEEGGLMVVDSQETESSEA